ncbi:TetR/AcrR family transcriptional regulator [Corynebacterium spheniscorum]|uniref:Transcriptional regulator, TetR family n=1 Tax=Corynebacterium spheniscorum TaxID=185761 RepID=A0A1I2TVW9_9CORY|nr:TetR/AcrR family transcriptional regulator [Corynebacterium spheniscorum]KAA8721767.1 TetR/AcrR family transcriptional regulator [Corynebacterium spheniscorum]SFG69020.1 transcriptional regulator, TetR family [Corynebacterium spheniscorum]
MTQRRRSADQQTRILNAFEDILLECGPRAATLDAVAKSVSLSRSGLLHHYCSRKALIDGLIERLNDLVDKDIEELHRASTSPLGYYIASSLDLNHPVERTIAAVSKLASGGLDIAKLALREAREKWFEALLSHTNDPTLVRLTMLVGDGLSYNIEMCANKEDDPFVSPHSVEEIIERLSELSERQVKTRA